MTINFLDEILWPYNWQYKTKFLTIGALLAHLRYRKKYTWGKVERLLGPDRKTLYIHFKKSKHFISNFYPENLLKPQIEALGREKIANMTFIEIKDTLPGYTDAAYYNILRDGKYKYKQVRKTIWSF